VKKTEIVVVNPRGVTNRVTQVLLPLTLLTVFGRQAGKNGRNGLSISPKAEFINIKIEKMGTSDFIPDEMMKAGLLTIGFPESGYELSEKLAGRSSDISDKITEVLAGRLGIIGNPVVITEIMPALKEGKKTGFVRTLEALDELFSGDLKSIIAAASEILTRILETQAKATANLRKEFLTCSTKEKVTIKGANGKTAQLVILKTAKSPNLAKVEVLRQYAEANYAHNKNIVFVCFTADGNIFVSTNFTGDAGAKILSTISALVTRLEEENPSNKMEVETWQFEKENSRFYTTNLSDGQVNPTKITVEEFTDKVKEIFRREVLAPAS
jgi:hypothetical protein